MNPLAVHASNFRTYEQLDAALPTGCVAILGENGSGKSSLIAIIELGLFGSPSRTLADYQTDDATDDLLIELEFEHAGATYRTRRTYSSRGRGKSGLDFEQLVDDVWTPLTKESTSATQAAIEATIGLSRETFCASAFLRQGDSGAFTEAAPRDRKKILSEVLGLDRWDALLERAKADRRTLDASLILLDARTQQARQLVDGKPQLLREHEQAVEQETVLVDAVADREREHAALAVRYQAAREHGARRQAAVAEREAAQRSMDALNERTRKADEAARTISAAIAELEQLPAPAQLDETEAREQVLVAADRAVERAMLEYAGALQRAQDVQARRADILGRASELNEKAEALRFEAAMLDTRPLDDGATCTHCGQLLGLEAREHALASFRADAAKLDAEAKQLDADAAKIELPAVPTRPDESQRPTVELAKVRADLSLARAASSQRAALEERIRQCKPAAASGPSPDEMIAATSLLLEKRDAVVALGVGEDLTVIEQQGKLAGERLNAARLSLEQTRQQRARLDERLAQIDQAEAELAAAGGERDTLQAQLQVVAQLERAFSPNGIPLLIVENTAIPYLESEATRILAELGGKTAACRVELRTQAALKSGDGVRDTLDVIVAGEHGERAYETFSGGERTRINLALRIALARLLAHRRGAESRLLVIDEPDGLDEAGMAALVEVLRSLEADFEKLYIVSHVPALRDSFDQVLTVIDDGGRSRVEDGYTIEAVAA